MNNETSETPATPDTTEPLESPKAPATPDTAAEASATPKLPETLKIPPPPQIVEANVHKHYLIKWKMVLTMQINGVNRTFHGWFGDISTTGATAYTENNLPINAQLTAIFLIPPKVAHGQPKTVQASCKSQYCVLGNNGMFRAGIKFGSFAGSGLDDLRKELDTHVPLQSR